jgi:hypothetical protein
MSAWDLYPSNYRFSEVQTILTAVKAGECVSVIGLSGSGKSNLLGFIANRLGPDLPPQNGNPEFILIDCNRLVEFTLPALFQLVASAIANGKPAQAGDELNALETVIQQKLSENSSLCLLYDRFDTLMVLEERTRLAIAGNLRALRDAFKYKLTFVTATRRPLDPRTELAELFYAHTLWLGPLKENDARWNISHYAERKGLQWDESALQAILQASRGYPSILRAVCEAFAESAPVAANSLAEHPAVRRRVEEFWEDHPSTEELRLSGLLHHPLLDTSRGTLAIDPAQLTAKEHMLWEYFQTHPHQVAEKDELIQAVWPEDRIFERGVRDDSLAQLIRRLREKVEPDPSHPCHIHTVPGRGYRFIP